MLLPHAILVLSFAVLAAPLPQDRGPQSAPTAPPARPTAPATADHDHAAPPPVVVSGDALDELPPIEVSPATINMGVAAPKAGMKGTASLKNTGTKPLRILAVTPSCKCTTTNDVVGKVIAPGETLALNAELEPVSMPQTQKALLRVLVEGYGRILEIPVIGEVALPVRSLPPMINAVEGKGRQGRFVVESIDKKPFTICAIGGRKPEFLGFTPGQDEPRNTYLVKYDLDTWTPDFPAYLAVETDRPDCPIFDVWVRSERTIPRPGLRMKDYRVNAGRIDTGGSADVFVDMEDNGEDILAVESGSDDVAIQLVGQHGDGKQRRLTLRVTPKGPRQGLLYAPFTIYGREKDQPLVLFASVRPKDATGCAGCTAVEPPKSSASAVPAPATR
jgi:hypothetical protein